MVRGERERKREGEIERKTKNFERQVVSLRLRERRV